MHNNKLDPQHSLAPYRSCSRPTHSAVHLFGIRCSGLSAASEFRPFSFKMYQTIFIINSYIIASLLNSISTSASPDFGRFFPIDRLVCPGLENLNPIVENSLTKRVTTQISEFPEVGNVQSLLHLIGGLVMRNKPGMVQR